MDARARRILRRLPRVNVYSVAELALMALVATQGARLVWAVVTPVSPVGEWRPLDIALPGGAADVLGSFDPFFRLSAGQASAAAVTSLQLTLFGTRLDEAMGRGSAIVAGPDGVQKSIEVGEEVALGVRLKSVAFDHVTLDRGGTTEDLFLDQSSSVTPVQPDGGAVATAGAPPPAAGPAGKIAAQIRSEIGFIPRIDDGRVSGLVVRSQGSGGLFQRSGLRDGDVVTAIGGRPVNGPGDIERVAADFSAGGNIPVTVERGGQTMPLGIPVTPIK
ncbi:general secretion pathway protein C [Sphingomonas aerophila]|uniref:General secretion pathway protein C n=2 Tax=Sphingomonas aerophila TaxID=1344948 RepID=A0A7W9BDY4_9SPHN|nr:general secretion pathway protein C [Sphingomonas aerophila]